VSRSETDKDTSQDDPPPEILRRLQVDDLWARRNVLAELMNAERQKTHARRRLLIWPNRFAAMDLVWKDPLARPPATLVPIKNRKTAAPGA
jgi:hypothetical protein